MSIDTKPYKIHHDSPQLDQKARLLSLAANETRLRIMCHMIEQPDACVSEIAENLNCSVQVVSHHMQMLRDNGLAESDREGNKVCYRLADHPLIASLLPYICSNTTL